MNNGRFEEGHVPYNKDKERSEITKLKIKSTKLQQENKELRRQLKCQQNLTEEKIGGILQQLKNILITELP